MVKFGNTHFKKKEEVIAIRVSEQEYEDLKQQLEKDIVVALEEEPIVLVEETHEDSAQEENKVLTIVELYNKIALLEKEIKELQKK